MKKAILFAAFAAMASVGTLKAQDAQRPDSGRRGPGRGMMMGGMLLKGITLSDAQKTQLDKLRQEQRAQMEAQRGQQQARPDRAQMEARRDAEFSAIRNILTADQQKQFDANLAEMKQRMSQGGGRRGERP